MSSDATFVALANPVRRRLLEMLAEGPRTAGSLAEPFDLSRPSITEHLGVLKSAGLVRDESAGRHRYYHLMAQPLADVEDWLHPFERFWRRRLAVLTDPLEKTPVPKSPATISVDQFIAASVEAVWRAITEPELLAQWWAAGDVAPTVGHSFTLDMPGWGAVPCKVLEVEPPTRLVYTFADWTLEWRLVAEGTGTRLLLEHSGFDLDDTRSRAAFDRMGPGWRNQVLPELARVAMTLQQH